jgi:DNA-binding protein HU-beta
MKTNKFGWAPQNNVAFSAFSNDIDPQGEQCQNVMPARRGETMTKADLVAFVADKAKITKKDADAAIGAFVEAVSGGLAKGENVALVGFGTFKVGARAAREGRNPRTGESIKIAAAKTAKFSPGKKLKDLLNPAPAPEPPKSASKSKKKK